MLFKYPIVVLLSCLTLAGCATPTGITEAVKNLFQGEARIALVIGNGDYRNKWEPLKSPLKDASDMKKALTEVGFEVLYYPNATQEEMKEAVAKFREKLANMKPEKQRVALFYYSGHGVIESQGEVCLVAVDAPALDPNSTNPKGFLPLVSIYKEINTLNEEINTPTQKGTKIRGLFILDNCRSPVEKSPLWTCRQTETGGRANNEVKTSESGTKGLIRDEGPDDNDPKRLGEPDNSFIASATRKYQPARDGGEGKNSPYTEGILEFIRQPMPVGKILERAGEKMVSEGQEKGQESRQKPVITDTITGDKDLFYLRLPPAASGVGF